MLTTNQKGAIAEMAITLEALRHGLVVLRPVAEGGRYDLVFDVDGRFLRVQCKWATRVRDTVVIRARTCRRGPEGLVRGRYSPDEIDLVAGYCCETDRSYVVPFADFPPCGDIQLRLTPAKNNQSLGLNWASNYEFGAIAQLGERVSGTHEVVGSSPTSSTAKPPPGAALF
ncbi:MAG: hypothetical protein QOH76_2839 [Thermoleophilaceae bacterium]|nr:hypothetical protein [Thermoleophilaceae bacterium]